jgi:hypothetical protein
MADFAYTQSIRAHYDGKFIVPDEPVQWPANTQLKLIVQEATEAGEKPSAEVIEGRKAALMKSFDMFELPLGFDPTKLSREDIYD